MSKDKLSKLLSTVAVAVLCISPLVMLLFEQEKTAAIAGSVMVGSALGSILGIIALVLNKGRSKMVVVLSAIPMCLIALFLLLAIPYYFYG